jgi:hypothetical protein
MAAAVSRERSRLLLLPCFRSLLFSSNSPFFSNVQGRHIQLGC